MTLTFVLVVGYLLGILVIGWALLAELKVTILQATVHWQRVKPCDTHYNCLHYLQSVPWPNQILIPVNVASTR